MNHPCLCLIAPISRCVAAIIMKYSADSNCILQSLDFSVLNNIMFVLTVVLTHSRATAYQFSSQAAYKRSMRSCLATFSYSCSPISHCSCLKAFQFSCSPISHCSCLKAFQCSCSPISHCSCLEHITEVDRNISVQLFTFSWNTESCAIADNSITMGVSIQSENVMVAVLDRKKRLLKLCALLWIPMFQK